MAKDRASLEALIRENRRRAAAEPDPTDPPTFGTLTLTEAAEPAELDTGAELAAPEEAPPEDLGGGYQSLFESSRRDLGGLADPNQSASANPYDSKFSAPRKPRPARKPR